MYTGIIKRRDLPECKYFFQNLENFLWKNSFAISS